MRSRTRPYTEEAGFTLLSPLSGCILEAARFPECRRDAKTEEGEPIREGLFLALEIGGSWGSSYPPHSRAKEIPSRLTKRYSQGGSPPSGSFSGGLLIALAPGPARVLLRGVGGVAAKALAKIRVRVYVLGLILDQVQDQLRVTRGRARLYRGEF